MIRIMGKLLGTMLGFVFCGIAVLLVAAATIEDDPREAKQIDQELWEFACATIHDTCADITPPKILKLNLSETSGIFGRYQPTAPWTGYLFIDDYLLPQLGRVWYDSVVVHEAVHYIDGARGRLDAANKCAVEGRGWAAGNAYVISKGRIDLVDNSWSKRYGCDTAV